MACIPQVPFADSVIGPSRRSTSSSRASYRPYPSSSASSSRSSTPAQRHRDAMSVPPQFVESPRGALRVYAYSPPQGPPGATITANIDFTMQAADTIFLRLVLGRRALTTSVRRLPDRHFELQARVPIRDVQAITNSVMTLSAQALNNTDEVVDTVTFGNFTVVDIAHYNAPVVGYVSQEDAVGAPVPAPSRPLNSSDGLEGLTVEIYPSDHYMQDFNSARATRPAKKASLIRTRRTASGGDDSSAKCASLSLESDLESMTKDWDKAELAAGRRLVRFTRIQDGAKLLVSCATVRQEDYVEGDTVISCIYREETDGCYVTSVDIILLLERLVGHEFDIEEKNRIRRNLEGFRPKTVSKNRPESSEFFLQIMNFPAPKPRNIEKDLKVFDWAALPQALEKIITRYTLPLPQPKARLHTPEHIVPSSASVSPLPTLSRTHSPAYSPSSSSSLATPEFASSAPYSGSPNASALPYMSAHDDSVSALLSGDGGDGSFDDSGFYDPFSYTGSTTSAPMTSTSCPGPLLADFPEKAYMPCPAYPSDMLLPPHNIHNDFAGLNDPLSSFDSADFDAMSQHNPIHLCADTYI